MRGDEVSKELGTQAAQLVALAREELGVMSLRRRVEGLAKLRARRPPNKQRVRLVVGIAAALIVAGLVFIGRAWLDSRHPGSLSYAVDGGRVEQGAVAGIGTRDPILRFSDGTEVIFLEGAHGHVRSIDEHGARIAVVGKARIQVVPWRESRWLFDVGPFLITVKGTAFTAEWKDSEERLEVALDAGTISVSGPSGDEPITLRAGQRLVISTREKEVVIRDIDSPAETGAPPVVRLSPATIEAAPHREPEGPRGERAVRHAAPRAPSAPAPSAPTPSATASWTSELAAGHFAVVLQRADQRGLEVSLAEASSEDLAALADAARYSRRDDVARRALVAQRRRFAKSPRASDAAFLLGRLEETAQHLELALDWYERYLDESTSGIYASEALGRKMTVVRRLYGAPRAQHIAEEYRRRFEGGTYAAAARALTRAP